MSEEKWWCGVMVTRDVVEFSSAGIHTTNPSHSGFDSQHRQFFFVRSSILFFYGVEFGFKGDAFARLDTGFTAG
jgi:hypothetical protein